MVVEDAVLERSFFKKETSFDTEQKSGPRAKMLPIVGSSEDLTPQRLSIEEVLTDARSSRPTLSPTRNIG